MVQGAVPVTANRSSLTVLLVCLLGLLGVISSRETLSSARAALATGSRRVPSEYVRTQESSVGKKPTKLEDGWWTPYVNETARAYDPWGAGNSGREPYGWCTPIDQTNRDRYPPPGTEKISGLIYVKLYKASSSTCEGVNIAIAHHALRRKANSNVDSNVNLSTQKCQHYNRHIFSDWKLHAQRNVTSSILWSFVRHPRARDISHVSHFQISREGVSPNQTDVLLDSFQRQRSFQSQYLAPEVLAKSLGSISVKESPEETVRVVQRIMNLYDFIGVTERMAESLAVMTLLWDLDPTSVIVLSAKQSGSEHPYDAGGYKKKCTRIQKPDLHPSLEEYLHSPQYMDGNADFLLYTASHVSLDLTIKRLGSRLVEERADLIERLQGIAEETCRSRAIFPCSNNGTLQKDLSEGNCYIQDAGCGYHCVDQAMEPFRFTRF